MGETTETIGERIYAICYRKFSIIFSEGEVESPKQVKEDMYYHA
jgi:hypothetical protein